MAVTTNSKWRLLDLYCGGGGATKGYQDAGFTVTGVDIAPQPRYCGDAFVEGDALDYLTAHGQEYDVIHASPPCQAYSALKHFATKDYPKDVERVRATLQRLGKPFVIENVVGAPLHFPLLLCGTMFGLETPCGAQLRRHRLFESSHLLLAPGYCVHGPRTMVVNGKEFRNEKLRCQERKTISVHGKHPRDQSVEKAHRLHRRTITVTGSTPQQNVERNWLREVFSVHDAQVAMGIDWLGMKGLAQALPPAYTHWIGLHLRRILEAEYADVS